MPRADRLASRLGIVLTAALLAACSRDLALPQPPVAVAPPDVPAALSIAPVTAVVAPGGLVSFSAAGGEPPYLFGCDGCATAGGSGGSVDETGAYTAGARGEVVDVIWVSDAAGASVRATVSVLTALTVVPSAGDAFPGERLDFLVIGGQPPYESSFAGGAASGPGVSREHDPDNPSLVHYRAGDLGDVEDVLRVRDAAGTERLVRISVSRALSVEPALSFLASGEERILVPSGGAPPYSFRALPWESFAGSRIDPGSGRVIAGGRSPGFDRITVADRFGKVAVAGLQVYASYPSILRLPRGGGTADVDGDGSLDLVLASANDSRVHVLRLDPAGAVLEEAVAESGASGLPFDLAIGDVVGPTGPDGIADAVLVHGTTGSLRLRILEGIPLPPYFTDTGVELPLTGLPANTAEAELELLDLSGDGARDAAILAPDGTLLLVDISPAGVPTSISAPLRVGPGWWLTAGDLNAADDDLDDLLVTSRSGDDEPARFVLLLADAPGSFPAAGRQTILADELRFGATTAVADVDGDGNSDLALAGILGGVALRTGDGRGGFTATLPSVPGTAQVGAMIATDLDHDGAADLLVTSTDATGTDPPTLTLHRGGPAGPGAAEGSVLLPERQGLLFAAGDPARPLVAMAFDTARRLAVIPTDGNARLGAAADRYATDGEPFGAGIADLNADGRPDVLVTDVGPDADLRVLYGAPASSPSDPAGPRILSAPIGAQIAGVAAPRRLAPGDLDGDGLVDVALLSPDGFGSCLSGGDGLVPATGSQYRTGTGNGGAIFDVDLDGSADLVYADPTGGDVVIAFGNGSGTLGGERRVGPLAGALDVKLLPDGERLVALREGGLTFLTRDVNTLALGGEIPLGGSYRDLALAQLGATTFLAAGGQGFAALLALDAAGAPGPAFVAPVAEPGGAVAVADVNGDGLPDLLVTSPSTSALVVLGGAPGPLRFGSRSAFAAGAATHLAAGDLNLDGFADVVVTDRAAGAVRVLWGGPEGLRGEPLVLPPLAYGAPCTASWRCGTRPLDGCTTTTPGGATRCSEACDPAAPACSAGSCVATPANQLLGYCR